MFSATQHLQTEPAASYEDRILLACFSCPSTWGVWVNHLYLVPTADGSLTDQAGLTTVPMDARPFRLIIQIVHINATRSGVLDLMALQQAIDTLVKDSSLLSLYLGTKRDWHQCNRAKKSPAKNAPSRCSKADGSRDNFESLGSRPIRCGKSQPR